MSLYVACMGLGWVVSHFFALCWCVTFRIFYASWHTNQKYRISIALDLCLLIVLLTMLTAVVLSTWMGVGGCGCPSLCKIWRITLASWAFRNSAPSSASAADAATTFKMVQVIMILPLRKIGRPCFGKLSRGKYLPTLLLDRAAARERDNKFLDIHFSPTISATQRSPSIPNNNCPPVTLRTN